MNRADRRRANRELNRAMRRGSAELEHVVASCGYDCGGSGSVVKASSMEEASAGLRAHYAAEHDGIEP